MNFNEVSFVWLVEFMNISEIGRNPPECYRREVIKDIDCYSGM